MDAQRLLNTFLDLVRIDSPSGHEAAVAAYIRAALEPLGCQVEVDDAGQVTGSDTGNVIATLPGTLPGSVVLTCHMDCVAPCCGVEPLITDGLIHTDGSTVLGGDDKVGDAAIIECMRSLAEGGQPHVTVKGIFTVQEEVGCCGAKALAAGALEPGEPVYVLDMDGNPGGATVGAPYHYTFTAEFVGKAAHAGCAPQDGIHAIAAAAKAVSLMQERGLLGAFAPHAAANVGTIAGGTANNVVPPSCTLTGECRAVDRAKADANRQAMISCLEEGAASVGARVEQEWVLEYDGFLYGEDEPAVQLFNRAAHACGLPFWTEVSAVGSDANIFASRGVTPIVVATGMTNFHSVDECLKLRDLEDTARIAIALVQAAAEGE